MSKITKEGQTIIIKPEQNLVASTTVTFRTELFSLLKELPKDLIIDLAGIDMVDSMGIGVIIATHNSLSKAGGKLRIINISKEIYNVFVTMRLNRHFTIEVAVN